jgi:hypothetical protein
MKFPDRQRLAANQKPEPKTLTPTLALPPTRTLALTLTQPWL